MEADLVVRLTVIAGLPAVIADLAAVIVGLPVVIVGHRHHHQVHHITPPVHRNHHIVQVVIVTRTRKTLGTRTLPQPTTQVAPVLTVQPTLTLPYQNRT